MISAKLAAAFVAIMFTSARLVARSSYFSALGGLPGPFPAEVPLAHVAHFFLIQLVFLVLGALFAVLFPR